MDALIAKQFPKQVQRRVLVATLLDQDVQHLPLVINRAPEVHPPARDFDHHLVQMPATGRRPAAPAQVRGDERTELVDPASNGFSADLDAPLRKQFLDVADAQGEPEIQADRMTDHVRREPMPFE